jgi:PadR family transcriptional regulator, regulatory protein PadR
MAERLGQVELMALLAVMRLGDEAYGVSIAKDIEATGSQTVPLASLYLALDRLEEKGLVCSALGQPTAARGGRAKRHFRITADGLAAVKEAREALTRMWAAIPSLRGDEA